MIFFSFQPRSRTIGAYRVGSDVTAAFGVGRVARAEITLDVQNGLGTAGSEDGGNQIERVTIGVICTIDGTAQCGTCGRLSQLALD